MSGEARDHAMDGLIRREHGAFLENAIALGDTLVEDLARAARLASLALRAGGTVFFCGNGGSASQAQHLATELAVKLDRERRPFRAMALGANAPLLTAAANDLGYDQVWVRELSALARAGDVLVILSTSGNSPNVVRAAEAARGLEVAVVGLLGPGGGEAAAHCAIALRAPGDNAQRVQEMHLFLGHTFCRLVETELLGG